MFAFSLIVIFFFYCQPDQVNIFGFLYQLSTLCSVYCLLYLCLGFVIYNTVSDFFPSLCHESKMHL